MDLDILPLFVVPKSSHLLEFELCALPPKCEANSDHSDWHSSASALQWTIGTRSPGRNRSLILPSQLQ